jgi:hypothetical protein
MDEYSLLAVLGDARELSSRFVEPLAAPLVPEGTPGCDFARLHLVG